jgi:vitamin B12 transporter
VGNEDLRSEQSVHMDVGWEQDLFEDSVEVGATWFSLRTSDLIAYDAGTFQLENLSRARTRGVELWARAEILEGLEVRGWLTLQEPRNLGAKAGEERRLPGRAKRFGGGEIRYRGDGWRAGVEVSASDDFPGTGKITPEGTRRSHPGRKLLVTVRGAVRICPAVWLHARVENLLDDEWYDDETAPDGLGRGFYGGVTVEF